MKMTDEERLGVIARTCRELLAYVEQEHVTAERIGSDHILQWTLTTPLYNIGEQVYKLSDYMRDKYPDVPWDQIEGLRHRLVHNYEGTEWSVVAQPVLEDVPVFLEQVDAIIGNSNN